MNKIKILGICGSLRRDSYNLTLLKAAQQVIPAGAELEIYVPSDLPLFSQDMEQELPEAARALKEKIRQADAILIASPEHNYSLPSALKNMIDWASRPYGDNALAGKPCAIMGASIGAIGTARMQYHLRQIMVTLDMHPINKPEVMVGPAQDKISEGELKDEKTMEKIRELLTALVAWTNKLK